MNSVKRSGTRHRSWNPTSLSGPSSNALLFEEFSVSSSQFSCRTWNWKKLRETTKLSLCTESPVMGGWPAFTHSIAPSTPPTRGSVSTSQLRKQRHREVKRWVLDCTAKKYQGQDSKPGLWAHCLNRTQSWPIWSFIQQVFIEPQTVYPRVLGMLRV